MGIDTCITQSFHEAMVDLDYMCYIDSLLFHFIKEKNKMAIDTKLRPLVGHNTQLEKCWYRLRCEDRGPEGWAGPDDLGNSKAAPAESLSVSNLALVS